MEAIEGLRFLASLPLAGTGRTEGGKKMQPFHRFHSCLFNSSLALIQISRKCRPDSCETQHIQTNIRTLIKFGVLCRKTYAERYNSFGMEAFERISFLASFGPPGTGRTEGGEKTYPFKRFHSKGVIPLSIRFSAQNTELNESSDVCLDMLCFAWIRPAFSRYLYQCKTGIKQTGMEAMEGLHFLASFGPPGTGKRKGGEKTQPFNRFHSHPSSTLRTGLILRLGQSFSWIYILGYVLPHW